MPTEDLKSIRRREDLPPDLRALSDVLDEYLVRMHGRLSGWVYPVEFREFLAEEGLVVVSREDLDTYLNRGKTLEPAGKALARLRAALTESPAP